MLFVVFSCSILFTTIDAIAQGPGSGKIIIIESFFGNKYQRNGSSLNNAELKRLLNTVPEAKEKFKSGKTMQLMGNILGGIGGFFVGYPIGQKIGGKESPDWTMAGIGGALILPGIILGAKGKSNVRNAIYIYNDSIGKSHSMLNNNLNIGLFNKGVYITYSF